MKTGSLVQVMVRRYSLVLLAALGGLAAPRAASAVQWRELARTARHSVALEMSSLRMNDAGRLTVWLRFTPRGKSERSDAAREYGTPTYQLHLEQYEIDCGEGSALLGVIDILGAGGKRLARLPGGDQPDAIIAGTVLDWTAKRVCPAVVDLAGDDEIEAPEAVQPAEPESAEAVQVPEELRQRIENARRRTESKPADGAAWIELGNAYYDADLPRHAVDSYARALKITPNDTNVLNDQGAMYRQTGEYLRALENFEKALAVDPANLESLYNMGYVYAIDLNRIDKGLEIWKRYLERDSASDTAEQVRSFVKHFEQTGDSR